MVTPNDLITVGGFAFAGGWLAGLLTWSHLLYDKLVYHLAYRRGLRHGLAQATLPPYLQDLS